MCLLYQLKIVGDVMCFEKIRHAEKVENPQYRFDISLGKSVNKDDTPFGIVEAALIRIQNLIVDAALASSRNIDPVELHAKKMLIGPLPDRSVVITGVVGQRYIADVHPDIIFATSHIQMDDKIIVFQLDDFCWIAEFALEWHDEASLPEDLSAKADVLVNLNFEFEGCQVYHYPSTRKQQE